MGQKEQVWIWTLGPQFSANYAKKIKLPVEAISPPQQLIDFYDVPKVMYFDTQPHTPEVVRAFAAADQLVLSVSGEVNLSTVGDCPNLVGGIVDDLSSQMAAGKYAPERLVADSRGVHDVGQHLRLYAVVYTMNFSLDFTPCLPHLDVVSLWVWDSRQLAKLDESVQRCREIFAGKPIVLGLYVYDYCNRQPVPLDLVQFEFRKARDYVQRGWIEGYQILGSYRVDELSTAQALWVRDFLR